MKKTTWMTNPGEVLPINDCPILYITLRTLKQITKVNNTHGKPSWRKSQFKFMVVVARIIKLQPSLFLSDNT